MGGRKELRQYIRGKAAGERKVGGRDQTGDVVTHTVLNCSPDMYLAYKASGRTQQSLIDNGAKTFIYSVPVDMDELM